MKALKAYMLKLLIGSIVRWLMTWGSAWVIAHNVYSNGGYLMFSLGMASAIGSLFWSQIQKLRTVFEVDEALRLPALSSFDDLKKAIG